MIVEIMMEATSCRRVMMMLYEYEEIDFWAREGAG